MSFMFHNIPLYLINFPWKFSQHQNKNHMFTNFDNYSSSNIIINVIFEFGNGRKPNVVVYHDVLVEDLIDKCFWNNKIIDYKESELTFIYNNEKLDKNLTLLEYEIGNFSGIQVVNNCNLLGGWFGFRDILY